MTRLIDADALDSAMYHKSFEVDDGRNVWNSGLWIRYKIYEEASREAPTVDAIPMWFFEMERKKVNYFIEDAVKHGDMDEAFRLEKTIAVMDGIIANWRREKHG